MAVLLLWKHQVLVGVGLIGGVLASFEPSLPTMNGRTCPLLSWTSLGRELQSEGVARILEQLVIDLGVLAIAAQ